MLINPPSKKCLRELVGIAGSSWREEQGKASNGGRYFAHLAGCVVAQTENQYKLSFCLGYIYLNLTCLKKLPLEILDNFLQSTWEALFCNPAIATSENP